MPDTEPTTDETKSETSDNSGSPLRQKILVFLTKKQILITLLVLLGILCLTAILIALVVRPTSQPSVNNTLNQIVDENGNPVAGAIVVSSNVAVATAIDGTYYLPVEPQTAITITANGYQPAYAYYSTRSVTLTRNASTSAMVQVGNTDGQVLPSALVIRLDPTTNEPVEDAVTNSNGTVVFTAVPAGQAMFVVLHPDYKPGWIETVIDTAGNNQALIRLAAETSADTVPVSQNNSTTWSLLSVAHAQEEDPQETKPVTGLGNLEFEIAYLKEPSRFDPDYTITQNTRTLIEVTKYKEDLSKYINQRQMLPNAASGLNLNTPGQKMMSDIYNNASAQSPIRVVNITKVSADITYRIDAFWDTSGDVAVKKYAVTQLSGTNWRVSVRNPGDKSTSLFIDKKPAVTINPNTIYAEAASIITNTEVPWLEVETTDPQGGTFTYLRPAHTICCRRDSDTTMSSAVSSATELANEFSLTGTNGNSVTIKAPAISPPDTSYSSGISIPNIPAPHPWEAPFGFSEGFLDAFIPEGSNQNNFYLEHNAQYQTAWENFLRHQATVAKSRGTSDTFANDILNEISAKRQDIQQNMPELGDFIADEKQLLNEILGIDPTTEDTDSTDWEAIDFESGDTNQNSPDNYPDEDASDSNSSSNSSSGGEPPSGNSVPSDYNAIIEPPKCGGGGTCSR